MAPRRAPKRRRSERRSTKPPADDDDGASAAAAASTAEKEVDAGGSRAEGNAAKVEEAAAVDGAADSAPVKAKAAPPPPLSDARSRLQQLHKQLEHARQSNTAEVAAEERRRSSAAASAAESRDAERRRERAARADLKRRKRDGETFVDAAELSRSAAELEALDERRERRRQRAAPSGELVFGEDNLRSAFERRLKALPATAAGVAAQPGGSSARENELRYGQASVAPAESVGRMVAELETTIERREKFSRRRAYNEDGMDIDFINERNRKFNKKIGRAFDQYTREVKQNLERGTALP